MEDYIDAHAFSFNNRQWLQMDSRCGCFSCLQVFHPIEINAWLEDGIGTAVCPYCGIDSVIGESAGYPLTNAFLSKMQRYWFGGLEETAPVIYS